MIDHGKLRFNGKLNSQSGLHFYFTKHGFAVSFLIDTISDKRKTIKVTMEKDPNHKCPHVHIAQQKIHQASFDVKTGELIVGKCDNRTQEKVGDWIKKHRKDLLQLWDVIQEGKDYKPIVEKIRADNNEAEEPQDNDIVKKG